MSLPPRPLRLVLLLALAALAAGANEPRRPDPFERTRLQIERLLAHRITPPPFDPAAHNPFAVGTPVSPLPTQPDEPPPVETAESLLRLLAARLKVTGYFAREGLSFAVVDGVPRRAGDFIIISHQGRPVNLQIRVVEPGQLVLALGDAQYLLRF